MRFPSHIPTSPGVYFFLDKTGKKLYIGKAANLRNRVRSYHDAGVNPRIAYMLAEAVHLEWRETRSEIEALILESQLIKRYKPKYNIMLRDDKSYAYVTFTDEEFPKIFITHRGGLPVQTGIGPFTSSTELRAALKMLRKLFPYCTCKQKHNCLCLNAHIGKCLGFCCLKAANSKLETESYNNNIKIIKDVLSGKHTAYVKQFSNVFVNARIIKEIAGRESALTKLANFWKLPTFPHRIEGYDISNIQGQFATGSMVVFEDGVPNKNEYRKFKIQAPSSPDDTLMLSEMLTRRFRHTEWQTPDMILIDGGKGQLNTTQSVLAKYGHSMSVFPVLAIAKGKQEIFSTTLSKPVAISVLPSSVRNLILHVDAEAHRFAISYYRKLHRKSAI